MCWLSDQLDPLAAQMHARTTALSPRMRAAMCSRACARIAACSSRVDGVAGHSREPVPRGDATRAACLQRMLQHDDDTKTRHVTHATSLHGATCSAMQACIRYRRSTHRTRIAVVHCLRHCHASLMHLTPAETASTLGVVSSNSVTDESQYNRPKSRADESSVECCSTPLCTPPRPSRLFLQDGRVGSVQRGTQRLLTKNLGTLKQMCSLSTKKRIKTEATTVNVSPIP